MGSLAFLPLRMVVGTHALIQEGVAFGRLGLVVVDEQHRFGVRQRMALAEQEGRPDVLVMSATSIPRSLAMALYGDLDLSLLDEIPPGREPVETVLLSPRDRKRVYRIVEEEMQVGRGGDRSRCILVAADPELAAPASRKVRELLRARHEEKLRLYGLGKGGGAIRGRAIASPAAVRPPSAEAP